MDAKIANLKEEDNVLSFTIYNTDVSYVNALRRTILSDMYSSLDLNSKCNFILYLFHFKS